MIAAAPLGFVVELLPPRGLDQSLLLPVLVGLWIVLLCTETFGWVFAGAVVPGYLASVLIVQPVTGVIVVGESLVTLAIASALARGLSETDAWTRFFGRERFFLILAVSLLVRVHDHAWFAPWAIASLDAALGTTLETRQEFYSVGLVLVPLTANMLWKPALWRGLAQLGVQVGATWVIVVGLLLPHTNLSLAGLELGYEDTAFDFVGHAKAHIVLLSAALVAAQLNLSYGWDFNGILVPALLALLWLTPLALLATVGEAIVVHRLVLWFLRAPGVRRLDFGGPRKISLVFTIAFVWKLALGFVLAPLLPELRVGDVYGFGYLLSSLLAVKMLGRKSVRAVLLPSLCASAVGFALGSVAGFVLELAAPRLPPVELELGAGVGAATPVSTRLLRTPLGVVTLARMQAVTASAAPAEPSQAELIRLRRVWTSLAGLSPSADEHARSRLRREAADVGMQVVELGQVVLADGRPRRWLGVVEREELERRGFAAGLVAPGARGPVLVVPRPVGEAPVAELGVVACRRLDCRALLLAGDERARPGTRLHPRPLEVALAAFADAPVVLLRADAGVDGPGQADAGVAGAVVRRAAALGLTSVPPPTPTRVHPLRGWIDVAALWLADPDPAAPAWAVDWRPRALGLRVPESAPAVALVRASPAVFEAMLLDGVDELPGSPATRASSVDAPLLALLGDRFAAPRQASAGAARYTPPSRAELFVLEQELVEPLITWARAGERDGDGDGTGSPPARLALTAGLLDYELLVLPGCREPDRSPSDCAVVLRERARPVAAGWGTLVVRRGGDSLATTVEVPRPVHEAETWRLGAELWLLSEAEALVIADADQPTDSAAPSPDPALPGNLETPFQAIHQAIDRRSLRGRAREVVQVRGLAASRALDGDVVVGVGQPATRSGLAGPGAGADGRGLACSTRLDPRLAAVIARWGRCRLADGSADLYPLSGAGSPQLESSRSLRNREVRVVWLSAGLRERYRPHAVEAQIRALRQAGFTPAPASELDRLLAPLPGRGRASPPESDLAPESESELDRAVAHAVAFAQTGNLHPLRALRAQVGHTPALRVEAGIGREWGRPFLLLEWVGAELGARALVVLDPQLAGEVLESAEGRPPIPRRLRAAALTRPRVLRLVDLPRGAAGR